jgi:regulator of sirC expression with transglutaminase-like and TPR domain
LGTNISNKLLPTYLKSRKGNCVTMPFLFILLGQKLGIELTATSAPKHILVKWKNEAGNWINLETTSGANPARDVWLRGQFPMTDEALKNGVYLQPLSKKETVALMASTLAEYYFEQQQYEKAIAISDVILEYYPKDVLRMTLKASAYGRLARKHFVAKYPTPAHVPSNERGYFSYLGLNNRQWFAMAESLGWREESKEDDEKYLQRIQKAGEEKAGR